MAVSPMQYLVAENGQRVGVVLSWEDYQQLQSNVALDDDLLTGMGRAALQALADGMLASRYQEKLNQMLERNQRGELSEAERGELDQLLDRVDDLNTLKARALYTLKQQKQK